MKGEEHLSAWAVSFGTIVELVTVPRYGGGVEEYVVRACPPEGGLPREKATDCPRLAEILFREATGGCEVGEAS